MVAFEGIEMFDEFVSGLPPEFGADVVDRALARLSTFEATAGDCSLYTFGDKLNGSVGDVATSDDREAASLLLLDSLICRLWLGNAATVARYEGRALVPAWEMNGGTFPPPVPAFPAQLLPYLDRRVEESARVDCRARYHDFVSQHPATDRRGSFEHARAARVLYMELGVGSDLADTTASGTAFEYLERAAQISAAYGIEREETARVILGEMTREMNDEQVGFAWHLAIAQAQFFASAPTEALDCIRVGIEQATRRSATDRHTERALWEIVDALASAMKEGETSSRAKRAIAESWEAEAAAATGGGEEFRRMAAIQEALDAYGKIGDGDAVQKLKVLYGESVKASEGALTAHQFEVNIETAKIIEWGEATKATIAGHPYGLIGLPFLVHVWPRWEDVEADFAKARADHPFQWLVSRYHVEPDGRVLPPPADDADRDAAYLLDHFSSMRQIEAGLYCKIALPYLTEAGIWSADAVIEAIREVDERLAMASESGIRAYFAGDFWAATHVLVPQLERSLRETGAKVSAGVYKLIKDQTLDAVTLEPILNDARMVQFMSSSVAACMAAVFVQRRGLNIRNNTAHGLYQPGDDLAIPAYFTLMGILTAAVASGTANGTLKQA